MPAANVSQNSDGDPEQVQAGEDPERARPR